MWRFGALAVLVWGCKSRPERIAAEGTECTSPYDDTTSPRLICAPPDRCLLMQSTPPPRRYLCLRACKSDSDCASLGAYRCEHNDGHGDEHGCTPR